MLSRINFMSPAILRRACVDAPPHQDASAVDRHRAQDLGEIAVGSPLPGMFGLCLTLARLGCAGAGSTRAGR